MYVCICNAFNDKRVKEHLKSQNGAARVADVYHACSDGKSPQCCRCIQTLKDLVTAHNDTVAA